MLIVIPAEAGIQGGFGSVETQYLASNRLMAGYTSLNPPYNYDCPPLWILAFAGMTL
jgi:hypothetical protein